MPYQIVLLGSIVEDTTFVFFMPTLVGEPPR